ncbi:hypothetical protein LEP1GSC125_2307 [Leptospira mayottensis 200901122]|uniref:Uncharacterized protein n=1 Tax=Leptospira mayottensis 200901122 TaxID=1193010 RepID=A0AA87MRF5_9LEPT|nr:hypothetical protein LEP1GSC125_2307 [Leptospira mayottensis 200901122]
MRFWRWCIHRFLVRIHDISIFSHKLIPFLFPSFNREIRNSNVVYRNPFEIKLIFYF